MKRLAITIGATIVVGAFVVVPGSSLLLAAGVVAWRRVKERNRVRTSFHAVEHFAAAKDDE